MRPTSKIGGLAAVLLASTAVPSLAAEVFNRVASFPVAQNLPADADVAKGTVSEIITVTEDGNTLIYTDASQGALGMVDITDPAAPKPAGFVKLEGDPTSVKVVGGNALVGVVTSSDKTQPAGHLAVVDIASKSVEAKCDLGGQPDSVATSPDSAFVAIAIENERDEELNDGVIPQMPAGNLTVIPVADGVPDCASLRIFDLTGIAGVAPEDPEAEFVDINEANQAVVTLQENNHIAIVDLASGEITAHFTAGSVDLEEIDTENDGKIALTGSKAGVVREPDAVVWLDAGRFVTADEGDWKGGSRTFTIFKEDGAVEYTSGASFEHEIVRLGHYPDKRNKKGIEPEGIAAGTYGDDRLIFVGSERASVVGVYRDTGAGAEPELLQILPAGIGPEGLLAIPERGLFVVANEEDMTKDGSVGAHVMIFARAEGEPAYPSIVSADDEAGLPIGWGALSGLAADAATAGRLYAVTDSIYGSAPRILTIDATATPARITKAASVTRDGTSVEGLDLEGIAMAEDGGFWLASEGNPKAELTNRLLKVSDEGAIEEEIELPAAIGDHATASGFEGVTVTGSGAEETVWLAVQREWGDDPKGMTKLLVYRPADKSWGVAHYPLEAAETGWVGLSEITSVGDDRLMLIERDNQIGGAARLKRITEVSIAGLEPAEPGSTEIPVVEKRTVRDLLADLQGPKGYVVDKVEGFAVDAAGEAFFVTDNDGVDGSSGETHFIRLGKASDLK